MSMQRVQLDISSDVFLENLPKNKVKLNFDNGLKSKNVQNKEQNLLFGDFLNQSQKVNTITKFDR